MFHGFSVISRRVIVISRFNIVISPFLGLFYIPKRFFASFKDGIDFPDLDAVHLSCIPHPIFSIRYENTTRSREKQPRNHPSLTTQLPKIILVRHFAATAGFSAKLGAIVHSPLQ
jgi:hypothetical protein